MIGAIVSGVISVLAGLFLAATKSRGADNIMEIMANGIGWYFIARGIYMISTSMQANKLFELLEASKEIQKKQLERD
jgi:vacuolar-type H+-ATPase subunit I/STV1